ncbi:MAG: M20/M25/M40 family metallo-hydrolase [Myxococcota bacterium]|nr:M20/M25/M40 family metallo-hydrolase [Myxococcota bacterium]
METFLLLGGLSLGQVPGAHHSVEELLRETDWATAEVESALLVSQYLRTDTTNPPGNESEGVEFLQEVLNREGIESTRVQLEEGRESLFARLEGSGTEGPLCLVSHIDVVPAEPENWSIPPDQGRLHAGAIWGRGALDMKAVGALHLQAFRMLGRLDLPLQRDVVLIAVADEEVGNRGIQQLIHDHWDQLGCSHAINEGGIGLVDPIFEDQNLYAISVGEKGVLWVRISVSGDPGHGSTPRPNQSPNLLLDTINRILEPSPDFSPPEAFLELARIAGQHQGGFAGLLLQRPFAVRHLLKRRFLRNPITAAGTTNTINLTGLEGAVAPNVVPSESSALLDIRLLPGTSTDDMLQTLQDRINDDRVTIEILTAREAEVSPMDDPVYHALAKASERFTPGAIAAPAISVGFTDSVFLRQQGVHAYGLAPFLLTEEEIQGMHGNDERISLENLARGLRITWAALLELALYEEESR